MTSGVEYPQPPAIPPSVNPDPEYGYLTRPNPQWDGTWAHGHIEDFVLNATERKAETAFRRRKAKAQGTFGFGGAQ